MADGIKTEDLILIPEVSTPSGTINDFIPFIYLIIFFVVILIISLLLIRYG